MTKSLILASNNQHKVEEVQSMLQPFVAVQSVKEVGWLAEIPETGNTFHENALIKAQTIYKAFQKPVLADDSGLLVDVLNGEPGVYSARYAGVPTNDQRNNIKLLQALNGVSNRAARFVTVLCLIIDGQPYYFEGELKGTISLQPSGQNGFGYDPIFVPEGTTLSLAELSSPEKNALSHRAKALDQLKDYLSVNAI